LSAPKKQRGDYSGKQKQPTLKAQVVVNQANGQRLRIVVEPVNRRLKIFRILAERYRNRRRRFSLRFNLIAAILNFELEPSS
jgi:hypothetical protein